MTADGLGTIADRSGGVQRICAAGIAGIALLRAIAVSRPELGFVGDPMMDPAPLVGIGPAGSLLLDVLVLVFCSVALWIEGQRRRSIVPIWFGLVLVPVAVITIHGRADFDSFWREVSWGTTIVAAITLAQLARQRDIRAIVLAILAVVAVPLVMRGLYQVFVEHPRDVEFYHAHRDQVLMAQGIDPDSNAAKIFERRLEQPEATGWFGLANVFGSVMVWSVVVWAGFLQQAVRHRVPSGWTGMFAILLAGCTAGLWYAGSKGALAAAAMGAGLFVLWTVRPTWKKRWGAPLVLMCVAAAIAAVVVRGILPIDFAGEKSILFRWQYLAAAFEIIAANPLTGVGADGFQSAYVAVRSAFSPEEVASAHSMFIDWMAALGILGAAWCAIVLGLLWRSPTATGGEGSANSTHLRSIGLVTGSLAVIFAIGIVLEWSTLDGAALLLRIVGGCAAIGGAVVILRCGSLMELPRTALAAAAVAIVAHGQIELTFTHPGAIMWAMCVVGIAAPLGAARKVESKKSGFTTCHICAVITLGIAVTLAATSLRLATHQHGQMVAAVEPLRELAAARFEGDETSRGREAKLRVAAGRSLANAYATLPANANPLEQAIEQLAIGSRNQSDGPALTLLAEARELAQRLLADHPEPASLALAARIDEEVASRTNDPSDWSRVIVRRMALAESDPQGLYTALDLADVLWRAGRAREARDQYARVLALNTNWYLDPLKQLDEKHLARIRDRAALEE